MSGDQPQGASGAAELREFTPTTEDVQAFAVLSGDVNPIHVDAVASRRLLFGEPVVHGMAGVLDALDAHFADGGLVPGTIQVAFRRPMLIATPLTVRRSQDGAGRVRLVIRGAGEDLTIITLADLTPADQWRSSDHPPDGVVVVESGSDAPVERFFADDGPTSGVLEVGTDQALFAARYPAVWSTLGPLRATGLATLSRLVGMVIPGLNSLFTGMELTFRPLEPHDAPSLRWQLVRAKAAIAPITIEVAGPGLAGTVDALFRPAPVQQPSAHEVAEAITAGDLRGQRVLVVGGSRGLGELLAKVAAAMGAEVVLTYARGRRDAEHVAAEINGLGGRCVVAEVEVADLPDLIAAHEPFAQVYYCATPAIIRAPSESMQAAYRRMYITAFTRLVESLAARGGPTSVFYPSTTYVADCPPGLEVYAAVKADGEQACADLDHRYSQVSVLVRRLPPMATDQTNALVQKVPQAALPIAIEIVREMAGGEPDAG